MSNRVKRRLFYVVHFIELPFKGIDEYVCVPSSWSIRTRPSDRKVVVTYPNNEDPFDTRDRVKRKERPNDGWRFHVALIKYESDDFFDAEYWITMRTNNEPDGEKSEIRDTRPEPVLNRSLRSASTSDKFQLRVKPYKNPRKPLPRISIRRPLFQSADKSLDNKRLKLNANAKPSVDTDHATIASRFSNQERSIITTDNQLIQNDQTKASFAFNGKMTTEQSTQPGIIENNQPVDMSVQSSSKNLQAEQQLSPVGLDYQQALSMSVIYLVKSNAEIERCQNVLPEPVAEERPSTKTLPNTLEQSFQAEPIHEGSTLLVDIVDEYAYVVVQFLQRPYADIGDYTCVPHSWIRVRRATDRKSKVAYPKESPSLTKIRIMNRDKPSEKWKLYMAIIKLETYSYEDAYKYISEKLHNDSTNIYSSVISCDDKLVPATVSKRYSHIILKKTNLLDDIALTQGIQNKGIPSLIEKIAVDEPSEVNCVEQSVLSDRRVENESSVVPKSTENVNYSGQSAVRSMGEGLPMNDELTLNVVSLTQDVDNDERRNSPKINSEEILEEQVDQSVDSALMKADVLADHLFDRFQGMEGDVSQMCVEETVSDSANETEPDIESENGVMSEADQRILTTAQNLIPNNNQQIQSRIDAEEDMLSKFGDLITQMGANLTLTRDMFHNLRNSILESAKTYEKLLEQVDKFNSIETLQISTSSSNNVPARVPQVIQERQEVDDENNTCVGDVPTLIREQRGTFSLPAEFDPNDTKWTLKYREYKPGLDELLPRTGVYVSKKELKRCIQESTDCRKLARLLLTEVFSKNALSVCSLTGGRAKAFNSVNIAVRPGLDEHARMVLLAFVEEHGNKHGWLTSNTSAVISSIRTKINEIRAEHGQTCRV